MYREELLDSSKKTNMDPLIELSNVTKVYNRGSENQFRALKGIDLVIEKGEFVAIMGASGSGKTTLMNILGALDTPSSGHYRLNGEPVSELNDGQLANFRNREVGFVFQQFNLLARLSVYDNVALPTLYGQIPDTEQRVRDVLHKVGIPEKIYHRPNQLSGGQIQRVAIARALVMNPAIIMADEPTGNLDSKTSYEIMGLFDQINQEGNTIILVTHEMDIAAYAKRLVRLRDGEIIEDKVNNK